MDGNTRMEDLEQHLLFHRALADDDEAFRRIGGYMDILSRAGTGERLQDPIDESIRAVFSLVLDNGIDPWEVNLSEFTRMYEEKVTSNRFDMIVAGKLLLMAWKILRLQSESTRVRSEPPVDVVEELDDSFFYSDDETMFVPEVSFREAFQRQPERPVTVYELIDAFEDARREVEIQRERERVRRELKAREPRTFDNKAHDEDDERDVESVWQRIEKLGTGQIDIRDLYTADMKENLTTFVSILHLVRDGRLAIWQDELPYGTIFLEIKTEWTSGTLEDNPDAMIPEAVNRFGSQGRRRGRAVLQLGEPEDLGHSGAHRDAGGPGPHRDPGPPPRLRQPRFGDRDSQDRERVQDDAPFRVLGLHREVREGGAVRRSHEDAEHHSVQSARPPVRAREDPRTPCVRRRPQVGGDGLRVRQAFGADPRAHHNQEVLGVLRHRVHKEGRHPQVDRVAGLQLQGPEVRRVRMTSCPGASPPGPHVMFVCS